VAGYWLFVCCSSFGSSPCKVKCSFYWLVYLHGRCSGPVDRHLGGLAATSASGDAAIRRAIIRRRRLPAATARIRPTIGCGTPTTPDDVPTIGDKP